MPFSSLIERLIPEGAVMAGSKPKTILADDSGGGSAPGFFDTSQGGNMLRALEEYQVRTQMQAEKEMKKVSNRADMYKTLRDSGYEPRSAYDAVLNNEFPKEPGGKSGKEDKDEAVVGKLKAQTEREEATTKKIEKQTSVITRSGSDLKKKIMDKVAAGDDLTPGEQKVYDEVIRKYGQKSTIPSKKKDEAAEYVPMIDPTGKKKLVPKQNVEKAKARGWKLR